MKKIALITGANRSIGLETAKQLSKKGLFVYLGTRDFQKGEAVVKELNENGFENIKAIQIDVTNLDTIIAAKNTIESEQGKLDILINNAGVSGGFPQSAIDTDIAIFKEVYDINVFGLIQVTQIFMDLLKKSDQPRITNLTSGLGSLTLHNDPTWQYYAVKAAIYNSSKAALNMYTITLAYELRETNFKVNVIDPGFTATDFNHHTGRGTVESAAAFVVKHTLTDDNAPTGKYFSNDIKDGTEISPW
ncbi:SDR family NAD(P)-dependent oxidoreductase [Flavobacterium sp.]|uniref:SDR family NAD(P)-dependent oxidoreductase n=1 Tax=Flavobacterium sp. TaxID=239 RepID=UPI00374FEC3A